jgi:hypothetical protein
VGIIEPAGAAGVACVNPVPADDGQHHVAFGDEVVEHANEIETRRNIVDVEKKPFRSEHVLQSIEQAARRLRVIATPIVDEYFARHCRPIRATKKYDPNLDKPADSIKASGENASRIYCLRRTDSGSINMGNNRYSITSSAIASKAGGTARPRIFAVFRLMTSSNFVGSITGRSVGFSPFRIRA